MYLDNNQVSFSPALILLKCRDISGHRLSPFLAFGLNDFRLSSFSFVTYEAVWYNGENHRAGISFCPSLSVAAFKIFICPTSFPSFSWSQYPPSFGEFHMVLLGLQSCMLPSSAGDSDGDVIPAQLVRPLYPSTLVTYSGMRT